jgi:hypothetical protein
MCFHITKQTVTNPATWKIYDVPTISESMGERSKSWLLYNGNLDNYSSTLKNRVRLPAAKYQILKEEPSSMKPYTIKI